MQYKIIDKLDLSICPVFIFESKLNIKHKTQIIGCYLNNELISILAIRIKSILFLKIGQILHQPILQDSQEIIDGFAAFISRNKMVDFIIPTPTYAPFSYYPKGAIACRFGTYILDLNQSEDNIFSNMHQKHRNVIRNVMKKKVTVVKGDVESAFQLIKTTMMRSNLPYPTFDELEKELLDYPNSTYCATLLYEGKLQAAIWLKFDWQSVYYLHGGTIRKPLTGAMNFLHWSAIKDMKKLGIGKYNFVGARINPGVGSKAEGIQRFKKRFGSEMVKGFMWKMILSPLKYNIYIYLIQIYSFLKKTPFKGDLVDQELFSDKGK